MPDFPEGFSLSLHLQRPKLPHLSLWKVLPRLLKSMDQKLNGNAFCKPMISADSGPYAYSDAESLPASLALPDAMPQLPDFMELISPYLDVILQFLAPVFSIASAFGFPIPF
uniref:Uncharacterized protein n=1 Tax=Cuerna arida TaxID=1464854 RepID=A0A1B6EMQ0_9HEMI